MSVIKRKRKHNAKVTVAIGGILLLILFVALWISVREIRMYCGKIPIDFYVLTCDKEVGEEVKETDLKKVHLHLKGNSVKYSYKEKAFIGKMARVRLTKGTVLDECMVCEKETLGDGLRQTSYSYIKQTAQLKQGDYVDVRISFPNGADFVVLSKKKVLKALKTQEQNSLADALYFALTEEEIMRMSSGVVDAYLTEGAYLYTVQYISDTQKGAIVNYPVNEVVEKLIKKDPNIVKIAQDAKTTELRSKIYDSLKGQEENVNAIYDNEGLTYFD